ncbi:MAG: transposase IS116/IS110/IS902 family protein [uncultured bacterium]|nr:MAG: transposase IS116/IS110/IS902 family protein [uncultured bacterium]
MSDTFNVTMYSLKNLCREYYNFSDTHSQYKKKLTTDMYVIFPGYLEVFDDITGKTSIRILSNYNSPKAILNAPKEELFKIIALGKQTINWRNNTYDKLIKAAKNACVIGIPSVIFSTKVSIYLSVLNTLEVQMKAIVEEIKNLLNSENIPNSFKHNLSLIQSIPGMGFLTSVTLLAEIGDIGKFLKPKHLVAYFGIDPSVNESGKYKGTNNKISKRMRWKGFTI